MAGSCAGFSRLWALFSREVSGFPNDLEGQPRRFHDIDTSHDVRISVRIIPFQTRSNRLVFVSLTTILSSLPNLQEEFHDLT